MRRDPPAPLPRQAHVPTSRDPTPSRSPDRRPAHGDCIHDRRHGGATREPGAERRHLLSDHADRMARFKQRRPALRRLRRHDREPAVLEEPRRDGRLDDAHLPVARVSRLPARTREPTQPVVRDRAAVLGIRAGGACGEHQGVHRLRGLPRVAELDLLHGLPSESGFDLHRLPRLLRPACGQLTVRRRLIHDLEREHGRADQVEPEPCPRHGPARDLDRALAGPER